MSDRTVGSDEPATTGSAEIASTVDVIVAPLDGSEFAARAVPVAAWLARAVGAELHLLGVVDRADELPRREADLDAAAGTLGDAQRSSR
jgi:nucleotide-binding universal stress UspA family protein